MSKKGTKAAPKEVSSYAERDIVLGKVRGFPPWPGMIVDPNSVPPAVQLERPAKKAKFYCVQFFPAGDYAWLVAKDISKLKQHEIESYINEPFKKSGDLLAGYNVALNPTAWEASRASIIAAAAQDNDDEGDSAEAEGDELDELESDAEGGKKKKAAPSKKRKRESEVKTRKPPKEKKEKEPKEKKERKAPAKGRKSAGAKSKAMVESEDEQGGDEDAEGEDAGPSNKPSTPPAKKARRDKDEDGEDAKLNEDPEANKVRDWRHRLQKALLSNKTNPEEADMPNLDVLFTTIESYDSITVAQLQFSKIGKVMRHITALSADRVPRDSEFHFRDRAQALVERWQTVLGTVKENGTGTSATKGGAKDDKPKEEVKANGGEAPAKKDEEKSGAAALDLNGTGTADADADGDADMVAPTTDADAPGEAEAEADAPGEVDAPADADITMSEA